MRYELIERDGFCRGCDKKMRRNIDVVVKFYSRRNRGQNIILCKECVEKMYNLVKGEE